MSTRERILTIRLLEKVKEHPAYAKALGIEAGKEQLSPAHRTDPGSTGVCRIRKN